MLGRALLERKGFTMGGKNHISNQVGASKVEYVLLVVLISVISVSALSFFGTEVKWRMAGEVHTAQSIRILVALRVLKLRTVGAVAQMVRNMTNEALDQTLA